jgi:hypothetical protein
VQAESAPLPTARPTESAAATPAGPDRDLISSLTKEPEAAPEAAPQPRRPEPTKLDTSEVDTSVIDSLIDRTDKPENRG